MDWNRLISLAVLVSAYAARSLGAESSTRSSSTQFPAQPPYYLPGCKRSMPNSETNTSLLVRLAERQATLSAAAGYPQGEDEIDVEAYELNFKDIDLRYRQVEVEAVLTIRANDRLEHEMVLDFRGFTISGITVDTVSTSYTRTGENSAKLRVALPWPIERDDVVTVAMSYGGTPPSVDQLGLVFSTGANGQRFVCTMSEPNGAHLWFPCNDRPDDKATLDLYATVRDGKLVASNGELVSETLRDGHRTFHWREVHPVSPYLIVLNAGDFHRVDISGGPVPISGWFAPSRVETGRTGLNMLPGLLANFEDLFGPYPFDKYGHADVPDFTYGAMEHQSLTSLHRDYLADRTTIAHELAHMWWGDLVGPASWQDLWLNEGFATYCEYLDTEGRNRETIGEKIPDSSSMDWSRALNDPDYDDLFHLSLVYYRGAWAVHHLRSYLGEEKFWQALLRYRGEHAFSSATSEDLRLAFEDSGGIDLRSFFERFIYAAGRPGISLFYFGETRPGLGSQLMVRYERTDGFDCSDVVFIRLNFAGGGHRIVRCVWQETGTVYRIYDERQVTGITIDPFADYRGAISVDGMLSAENDDGDMLPDGWELAMFGDTGYGGGDDPDGDGHTNTEEREADTDPTEAMSAPRIAAAELTNELADARIRISFPTTPFAYYTLQQSFRPGTQPGVWTTVQPKAQGTGSMATWSQPIGTQPSGFYRLLIESR